MVGVRHLKNKMTGYFGSSCRTAQQDPWRTLDIELIVKRVVGPVVVVASQLYLPFP